MFILTSHLPYKLCGVFLQFLTCHLNVNLFERPPDRYAGFAEKLSLLLLANMLFKYDGNIVFLGFFGIIDCVSN
ncbi:hypothetical protein CCE29_00350 [Lacticaseibacillus rhamnosus]|uniref:Uncharacterized protein n=1 Tax=Lacticaseibacillus rhamnosus (strain ATCC 53103 / LMG 18243 / GG) TaxID=568703 RepID=A0A7S7JG62_LACRG|nr:hypothetical protein B4583_04410 [Lacticaseibacillus rhamnosus]AXI94230.1 hypothetical protein DU507_06860 [Lacticaseibacillus rhamnosus GG]ART94561.1 hypothetical protein CCE29_00350 [Lacticaseibacillus rhamnosus]AZZ22904.1 hypothetical protein CYG41_06840 [Lacticaseibacillus rhamnosus]MCT3190899.1 hypothetical protein [Lacticaseibacillus rhamnosus]